MPETSMIPSSVMSLLDQSTAAAEVPDPSAFVNSEWLASVSTALEGLFAVALADADSNALKSFRGNGLEVILLARDRATGCNVYLRRHCEGHTVPVLAGEKTVTMTLSGRASLEAFRDETDVESDEPWYVRDFDPESLYACHPGTIHRVELSPDSCQVILSREELDGYGSQPLGGADYSAALADMHGQIKALARGTSPGLSGSSL